jgi:hypothetical protein
MAARVVEVWREAQQHVLPREYNHNNVLTGAKPLDAEGIVAD